LFPGAHLVGNADGDRADDPARMRVVNVTGAPVRADASRTPRRGVPTWNALFPWATQSEVGIGAAADLPN
jgi:hypothetical protein